MTTRRTARFFTPAVALLVAAPAALRPAATPSSSDPVAVVDAGEIAAFLAEQVQLAESEGLDALWSRAASLRGAALAFGRPSDLDAALDDLLESADSSHARLLLSALRLQGSDPDVVMIHERLHALAAEGTDDLARGALGLYADPHFKALRSDERDELRATLRALVEDGNRAPAVRLDAGYALHVHGDGDLQRVARRQMRDFLKSSDPALRGLGAMTLARTGAEITGELYAELERLARVPGPDGHLASAYLKQERIREETNRKVKAIQNYYEGGPKEAVQAKKGTDPAQQFQEIMEMVQEAHLDGDKVDEDRLLNAAMDGMLSSLDRHSTYFSPAEYTRFEQGLEGSYGGIGAYVSTDRQDNLFTITRPIYSGPAWKKGLRTDDKIVRIDDWSTVGQPLDKIIKRLKGRPGTTARLYIWRKGMDAGLIERPTEAMAVEVERQRITIPPLAFEKLPGDIGMVELREFSRVATRELKRVILEELLPGGMRGLVLDLRNNPGGLLDEARDVVGLFMPKGTLVVTTDSRLRATVDVVTQRDPVAPDLPVMILINRYSASASEIVSGALQHYGRAVVVGKRSFGKGSVQNLLRVRGTLDDRWDDENKNGRHDNWERLLLDHNGNGEFDFAPRLKLTVARYLLPGGRSIHRELDEDLNIKSVGGVLPDWDIDARRIESWRLEEMYRIVREERRPQDYVDRYYEAHAELYAELAENDRRDWKRYPGFEEFMASLDTPLSRDDVRSLLRAAIRRRVQDDLGRDRAGGDYVEDLQLQKAIALLLEERGEVPLQYEEYAATFNVDSETGMTVAVGDRDSVQKTLEEIAAAQAGDGRLEEETLERLTTLLEDSLE